MPVIVPESYFNKNQHVPVVHDQVNLTGTAGKVPLPGGQTASAQKRFRLFFPVPADLPGAWFVGQCSGVSRKTGTGLPRENCAQAGSRNN